MKAKRGKCLALVAVLAMVVCAFAVALPAGDSDAATSTLPTPTEKTGTFTQLTGTQTAKLGAKEYYVTGAVTLFSEATTETAVIYLVGKDASVTTQIAESNITIYLATAASATSVTYYSTMSYSNLPTTNTYSVTKNVDGIVDAGASAAKATTGAGVVVTKGVTDITSYLAGADVSVDLDTNTYAVTVLDGGVVTVRGGTTSGSTFTPVNTIVLTNVTSDSTGGEATVTCGESGALTYTGTVDNTSTEGVADVSVTLGAVTFSTNATTQIGGLIDGTDNEYLTYGLVYYTDSTSTYKAYKDIETAEDATEYSGYTSLYFFGEQDGTITLDSTLATVTVVKGEFDGTVKYQYTKDADNIVTATIGVVAGSGSSIAAATSTITLTGEGVTAEDGETNTYLTGSSLVLESVVQTVDKGDTYVEIDLVEVAIAEQSLNYTLTIPASTGMAVIPKGETLTFLAGGEIEMKGAASTEVSLTVLGELKYDQRTADYADRIVGNGHDAMQYNVVYTDNKKMVTPYVENSSAAADDQTVTIEALGATIVNDAGEFIAAVAAKQNMILATDLLIYGTVDISDCQIDLNGHLLQVGGTSEAITKTVGSSTNNRGSLSLTNVILNWDKQMDDSSETAAGTTVHQGDDSIVVTAGSSLSVVDSKVFAVVDVDEKAYVEVDNDGVVYDGTASDVKVGYGTTLSLNGKINTNIEVYGDLIITSVVSVGSTNAMNVYNGATVTVDGELDIAGVATMYDGSSMLINGKVELSNNYGGAEFVVGDTTGADVVVSEGATFTVKATEKNRANENVLQINNEKPTYTRNTDADTGAYLNTGSWNKMFAVYGTLDIKGTLSGYVYDAGTVEFNGKSDDGCIVLTDGITFTAASVTGELTVTDDGVADDRVRGTGAAMNGNEVVITGAKGVTVTTAVSSVSWKDSSDKTVTGYYATMDVSGTFSAVDLDAFVKLYSGSVYGYTGDANTTGKKYATITVSESITVSKETTLEFGAGNIYVSGTIDAVVADPSTATTYDTGSYLVFAAGTVDVTGHITVLEDNITYGTMNAAEYAVTGTDSVTYVHLTSFDEAVTGILDADDDAVQIHGSVKAKTTQDIPEGAEITMDSGAKITVSYGVTVTLKEGAELTGTAATLSVSGTFVAENAADNMNVKTVSADVIIQDLPQVTWTTLANAIALGMTEITLNQGVYVYADLEIPEGVTVTTNVVVDEAKKDYESYAIYLYNAKLTVNGTLSLGEKSAGRLIAAGTSDIVVNGILTIRVSDVDVESKYSKIANIDGAHFVESQGAFDTYYITNIADAAEITAGNQYIDGFAVKIVGVAACGDVAFVGTDDILTITMVKTSGETDDASILNAGTITLLNAKFVNTVGQFNGKIATADAVFSFNGAQCFTVQADADGTFVGADLVGDMALESGEATVAQYNSAKKFIVSATGMFSVADGAKLTVPADYTFVVDASTADEVTAVIDGTIVFKQDGLLDANDEILISGTMEVSNFSIATDDKIRVTGTLAVADDKLLTIYGNLILGQKTEALGATGTVTGTAKLSGTGAILAYAGASMDADLNINTATGESDAVTTTYYINGTEYATIYALANKLAVSLINTIDGAIELKGLVENTKWYEVQDYKSDDTNIATKYIGAYAKAYSDFAADTVTGKISKDAGIIFTIDSLVIGSNGDVSQTVSYPLSVGTHVIKWSERSGYSIQNVKVTFNGQEIKNGDTITITADMESFLIVASGAEPYVAPTPEQKDEGMKVTDYLLIVLVVLIAIMAIMVALRLMRS